MKSIKYKHLIRIAVGGVLVMFMYCFLSPNRDSLSFQLSSGAWKLSKKELILGSFEPVVVRTRLQVGPMICDYDYYPSLLEK